MKNSLILLVMGLLLTSASFAQIQKSQNSQQQQQQQQQNMCYYQMDHSHQIIQIPCSAVPALQKQENDNRAREAQERQLPQQPVVVQEPQKQVGPPPDVVLAPGESFSSGSIYIRCGRQGNQNCVAPIVLVCRGKSDFETFLDCPIKGTSGMCAVVGIRQGVNQFPGTGLEQLLQLRSKVICE